METELCFGIVWTSSLITWLTFISSVKTQFHQQQLYQNVWTRKRRKGIRQRRCQETQKGPKRQHPGHYEARYPPSRKKRWCQAYLGPHLRGDQRRLESFPWERHQRCSDLHWARSQKDRHRSWCSARSQETGPHSVRLRRLNSHELSLESTNKPKKRCLSTPPTIQGNYTNPAIESLYLVIPRQLLKCLSVLFIESYHWIKCKVVKHLPLRATNHISTWKYVGTIKLFRDKNGTPIGLSTNLHLNHFQTEQLTNLHVSTMSINKADRPCVNNKPNRNTASKQRLLLLQHRVSYEMTSTQSVYSPCHS